MLFYTDVKYNISRERSVNNCSNTRKYISLVEYFLLYRSPKIIDNNPSIKIRDVNPMKITI